MSQPRKSERSVIPTEKAKNSELDISKMLSANKMSSIDDDTQLLSLTMNDNGDESELLPFGSDNEDFGEHVTMTSTQKDNDEENKAEIQKLNEKILLLEINKGKMEEKIKELTDDDRCCTTCKSNSEKLIHMTEK